METSGLGGADTMLEQPPAPLAALLTRDRGDARLAELCAVAPISNLLVVAKASEMEVPIGDADIVVRPVSAEARARAGELTPTPCNNATAAPTAARGNQVAVDALYGHVGGRPLVNIVEKRLGY
jgi:hypothetical protein